MTEAERAARARIAKSKMIRKKKLHQHIAVAVLILIVVIGLIIMGVKSNKSRETEGTGWEITSEKYIDVRPELDVQLLPVNKYSRPGKALEQVKGIVIHYTANPGTSAQQNRDYFANLAKSHETSASSHFVIGLDGEIIQCIPCDEIAYASNERNQDTIAIECCIEDDTGQFNDKTYHSLISLVTWLIGRYDLGIEDVIRHYDVTGKNCPKYFVEHEDAWENFKSDLASYIAQNGVDKH